MSGASVAATLLAVTLSATPADPAAPPVVLLTGGTRLGTGIVWNASEGLVLTALHVVEGMPEILVVQDGEPARPARLVDAEPALDLVLLRASAPLRPTAPVEGPSSAPGRGDRVTWVGYPGGRVASAAVPVLEPVRKFAGAYYVELGARAEPGASGSPVLDARGAVVGIVDLVLAGGSSTLAIPIDAAIARFPGRGGPADGGGEALATAGRDPGGTARRADPD